MWHPHWPGIIPTRVLFLTLIRGVQRSVNVHRGALLLVPQWQCISSCILHFCHTCSLFLVELVVQFRARGSTQVLCLFPGVLWLWHFLYSVGPHPVSSLHINTFVVSRAFMTGAASQAGDADSSRQPGITSGLQKSVNIPREASGVKSRMCPPYPQRVVKGD